MNICSINYKGNGVSKMGTSQSSEKREKGFTVKNPHAAGIDLGAREHYACVLEKNGVENIKTFGCYTVDIKEMAKWFKKCGVTTVAMESTGVEWVPVYDILEHEGFDVKLVNSRHLKNVSGKKTDVSDCQWIRQLHTFGLLQGSFRPDEDTLTLRGYVRHRGNLTKSSKIHIQRMQKALTQMNVHIHKAISDITGVSGLRILKAIIAGNHNPQKLAELADSGIKNSKEIIAKSLEGNFRAEHLFTLKQEFELYEEIQKKIIDCDGKIEEYYKNHEDKGEPNNEVIQKKKKQKSILSYNLEKELYRVTGIDFTQIDGIGGLSAQKILSEIGLDPSKWPTEKHFSSWLGLCPNNKITGGKIQSSKTKKVVNKAAVAFRQAASTLQNSKSALGAYHRRMRGRLGPAKAMTATAHKLACIFYRMMKYGKDYVDIGVDTYEEQFKQRIVKSLKKRAKEYGFALVNITDGCVVIN
jgi:transposase